MKGTVCIAMSNALVMACPIGYPTRKKRKKRAPELCETLEDTSGTWYYCIPVSFFFLEAGGHNEQIIKGYPQVSGIIIVASLRRAEPTRCRMF